MFKVTFWGVRGSIPVGHSKIYGGETSCVQVQVDDHTIILDAGTGIFPLGWKMTKEHTDPINCSILLSHYHWDHIQGFQFFHPLRSQDNTVTVYGPAYDAAYKNYTLRDALVGQMSKPYFPIPLSAIPAKLSLVTVTAPHPLQVGPATVQPQRTNHPGGCSSYRIEHEGKAVVYLCDYEHQADLDIGLVEHCKNASLLIYDGTYFPKEYSVHKGWGHSTYEHGKILADEANVESLVITHHEPTRMDEELTNAVLRNPNIKFAHQGLSLVI